MKILAEYPAYKLYEPRKNAAGATPYQDGQVFAIPYQSRSHGELYDFFTLGSVVAYALKYSECPEKALARSRANGHDHWWASANAVSITAHKRDQEVRPMHQWGDIIQFHGRLFRLDPSPNHNCKLTLMGEVE